MAQWFDITAKQAPSLSALCAAFGVTYNPNDPYGPSYTSAVNKGRPSGGKSPYQSGGNWDNWAQLALRGRGLFFSDTQLGDCLAMSQTGLSGADTALSIGVQAAASFSPIPIPGLGAAIGFLDGADHAAAVANEKSVLCQLVGEVNPRINNIYDALESGTVSSATALAAMQALATQFAGACASITKSCNDSCGMNGIMAAHVAFIQLLPTVTAQQQSQPSSPYSVGPYTGGGAGTSYVVAGNAGAAGASAPVAQPAVAVLSAASSSIPTWLWFVIGLLALAFFVHEEQGA